MRINVNPLEDMSTRGRPRKYPVLNGPVNNLIFAAMTREGLSKPNDWADKWLIGRTALRTAMVGRQSQIGTWVRPDVKTLQRLAKALEVPLVYLITQFYEEVEDSGLLFPQAPVLGWVGAGPGEQEEILEKFLPISMDQYLKSDLAGFKVRGLSMCAGDKPICDGNWVLADRQNHGRVGSRVVAQMKDGGYVCKLLKEGPKGRFLISTNPSVENGYPAVIEVSQIKAIFGKVVEVRTSEDSSP
jgi:repressor LexA